MALFFILSGATADVPFATAKGQGKISAGTKINYDFTKMNYNMATGIVFDMMIAPENYKGKTAKIKGQFLSEIHEGQRAFAVVVWDATGCCPTGLTIVPLEGKKYPDDFPKEESQVTVAGTLEIMNLFGGETLCLVAETWE